jgi:hypothetical protein
MASALRFASAAVLLQSSAASSPSRRLAPIFDIDLDASPDKRYEKVVSNFNSSIQTIYQEFFFGLKGDAVRALLFGLAAKRGKEVDVELQGEIEGIAKLTGLPVYGVHSIQMLYELNTLMVPIENITLPWTGPGCTGIIAMNKEDGMVYHGRDQDFSPAHILQDLVYTGVFKKGGKELFKAQMIAAFTMPLTGMRSGANGFTFETNTRYFSKNEEKDMLKNLLKEKRPFNNWSVRKAAEECEDYECFIQKVSVAKYVAPMYNIISGVKKGAILARGTDGVTHQLTLGQPNYGCRDDYIIVTNFDFWDHDIKEWFDPTSEKGLFHPRRIAAQKLLNTSEALTPDVVFSVIDDDNVRATDTIYQALMSVEAGVFNVSLPACKKCGNSSLSSILI